MGKSTFIEKYNELFKKSSYVHVSSDDLRLAYNTEVKIRKHNRDASKSEYIKLKDSRKDKLKKLKEIHEKNKNSLVEEIISLLEFRDLCESEGIKENEIKKKRELICKYIANSNPTSSLKIIFDDIIYDDRRITFELIDSFSTYKKKLEKRQLINRHLYYRGQQNINWVIEPSIFRGEWINHEKEFIHDMVISNPIDFENAHSTLEKLTKMQHYNAPTRLLDITTNPYIALYFACEQVKNCDDRLYGEIVFIESEEDTSEKYYDGDTISILSNLAMMDNSFELPDESLSTESFNNEKGIPFLLHQIKTENPSFQNLIEAKDLHKCFIVHVKHDNKRIMNQQGLFLIVGMGNKKNEPANIKNSFHKIDKKQIVFVIPDKNKKDILNDLDLMSINKKFIYPEIDDVADYLKTEVYKQ